MFPVLIFIRYGFRLATGLCLANCADESALFAICSCFAIIVVCFTLVFKQSYHPALIPPLLEVTVLVSISTEVPSVCWCPLVAKVRTSSCSHGCHENLPAVPHNCTRAPLTFLGTSSQAHLLATSLIIDNYINSLGCFVFFLCSYYIDPDVAVEFLEREKEKVWGLIISVYYMDQGVDLSEIVWIGRKQELIRLMIIINPTSFSLMAY